MRSFSMKQTALIFAALFGFGVRALTAYDSSYETLRDLGLIPNLQKSDLCKRYLDTSAGRIAYFETSGREGPIVLIHGNSCSKEFMMKQLDGLGLKYKMIALDLPGHGESSNALRPSENYTLAGYASLIVEMIQKLELGPVILVGWSLGGDVAIEAMAQFPQYLKGVVISGTPPVVRGEGGISEQGIQEGYCFSNLADIAHLVAQLEPFSYEDVQTYWSTESIDLEKYPLLADACQRTDGLARHTLCSVILRGEGANEKDVVAHSPVPLGIIMGVEDHGVNNSYIQSLTYANCLMMEAIGGFHDCQWSHPEDFNRLLDRFAIEVSSLSKK